MSRNYSKPNAVESLGLEFRAVMFLRRSCREINGGLYDSALFSIGYKPSRHASIAELNAQVTSTQKPWNKKGNLSSADFPLQPVDIFRVNS